MFDDLARQAAGTLQGVFGRLCVYERPGEFRADVPVTLRRDVEVVDESGQVSRINYVARINHADVDFEPKRGDQFVHNCELYTVARRLSDNGYVYEYEATA
jgi:hypothetical protein